MRYHDAETKDADPIPRLWQRRELLAPLLSRYGAYILDKALTRRLALETSRSACSKLAALMMALTDFREWYSYSDFYIPLIADASPIERW